MPKIKIELELSEHAVYADITHHIQQTLRGKGLLSANAERPAPGTKFTIFTHEGDAVGTLAVAFVRPKPIRGKASWSSSASPFHKDQNARSTIQQ